MGRSAVSDVLVIVPCRAGSSEVPRKSQQLVAGVPLVTRTLTMLADVGNHTAHELTVLVSTDDPVVAEIAAQHGVPVHQRRPELCDDKTTLAAVVADAASALGWTKRVGCAQVTSPWLEAETVALMVDQFCGGDYTTASTVAPETDLRWLLEGESKATLHGDKVARQTAGVVTERETGGLRLWLSPDCLDRNGVGGAAKHLHWRVTPREAIDIDTPFDLAIARLAGMTRRILFVIEASDTTGSGHLHRCLTLADQLSHHHIEVAFVADPPEWAWDAVESHGVIADAHRCWQDVNLTPGMFDCVVFDRLDTNVQEVGIVKAMGAAAVSLEDRGSGSALCDLVVNELYEGHQLSGPDWAVLRPEFCGPPSPPPGKGRVLVTFGGTDPAGLNERVATVLATANTGGPMPVKIPWQFTVVCPPSTKVHDYGDGVTWVKTRDVPMAALMRQADVVVTSQGRTVTEAMAMGRPVVSIAANVRELDHHHHRGVVYLGPHWCVTDQQITAAVSGLLGVASEVGAALSSAVDGRGAQRIARLIDLAARGE